jgi:hypothetical protein
VRHILSSILLSFFKSSRFFLFHFGFHFRHLLDLSRKLLDIEDVTKEREAFLARDARIWPGPGRS